MDEQVDSVDVALKDLIQSEGWRVFKAAVDNEWGPLGYGREMQRALSSIPPGPDRAYELARVAEQVEATAQAVHQIIAWPTEELKRRSAKTAPPRGLDRFRRLAR
jgi:hypothetical protein